MRGLRGEVRGDPDDEVELVLEREGGDAAEEEAEHDHGEPDADRAQGSCGHVVVVRVIGVGGNLWLIRGRQFNRFALGCTTAFGRAETHSCRFAS